MAAPASALQAGAYRLAGYMPVPAGACRQAGCMPVPAIVLLPPSGRRTAGTSPAAEPVAARTQVVRTPVPAVVAARKRAVRIPVLAAAVRTQAPYLPVLAVFHIRGRTARHHQAEHYN